MSALKDLLYSFFSRDENSYIRSDSVDLFRILDFRVRHLNRIQIFTNLGLDLVRIIAGSVRIRVRVSILIMYFKKKIKYT